MQIRKLHEQQSIKPTVKQISADTRIAALEAKLGNASQPKEGDVKKKEEILPKNQSGGETGEILEWLVRHWVQSIRNLADS